MSYVIMQAVDDTDGTTHFWTAESADWAGAGYPGPNAPVVSSIALVGKIPGDGSGAATITDPTCTNTVTVNAFGYIFDGNAASMHVRGAINCAAVGALSNGQTVFTFTIPELCDGSSIQSIGGGTGIMSWSGGHAELTCNITLNGTVILRGGPTPSSGTADIRLDLVARLTTAP